MGKPTKYELAHEEARRNAIKLLGLHEKNTAKDRARAMGFDTSKTHYHSSLEDTKEFKPVGQFMGHTGTSGISVTDNPEMASRYLDRFGEHGYVNGVPNQPFGKNVIPVHIKPGKVIERDEPYHTQLKLGAPLPSGYIPKHKKAGFDTLIRNDAISKNGPVKHSTAKNAIKGKELVLSAPEQIRSRFAAYDPARAHEPDLLAAKGGAVKKYAAGGAATKDKALSIGDFYAHFPNIEKHIDLEHGPRPFHFELPPEMRGKHTGFDIRANHKIPNGAVKERVIVSPKAHEVEYDRTSLKHFVKQGK